MAQRDFSSNLAVTAVISAAVTTILMVMMIAVNLRIIAKCSGKKRLNRIISAACHTAEQLDTRIRQRSLRSAANSAADQRIDSMPEQEARQRTMAAVTGIHHFCCSDLAVLHLIQLKLRRMSKMLIDLPIFISYCDFHIILSFSYACYNGCCILRCRSPAARTFSGFPATADPIVSAGNSKLPPVDNTGCQLSPCAFINFLYRGAGNIHLQGARLVGLLLQIHQSNHFIFIQRQKNWLFLCSAFGAEGAYLRQAAYSAASLWSCHRIHPFISGIYRL